MADLNSTIVRGNLRVTEDINANGRITGGNITGHLALNENTFNINFRPNLKDYTTGFYYGTTGNEALTLTTKNAVTAIQFMNGQDPATLVGGSWRDLVPALQIKYNKVAINKALGENAEPSYNLDVNGSIGATTIYEEGTALINKYTTKYENNYIPVLDTRASNTTPYASDNYPGKVTWHLKDNSAIGISGQGSYSGVLQLTPWADSSGGSGHQLAFGTNGAINHRYGTTEWSGWKTLIDSANIGSQSVNYAATAGSANSATKATQDGNGNTITTTYVAKADKPTASTPGPVYMTFSNGILTISDEPIS